MKKWFFTMCIVVMCFGCSQVTMTAPYRQTVGMSAIRVNELNERCQDGDELACKEGLAAASKTLNLIVNAMEGRYED